ncbi:MAG: winged helix-turn-helix domain-containing protein [archaeon]
MAEITLDKKTFEALAIDTRVKILKSLRQRRKTQSELAKELGVATSTVSEHLEKMGDAGLITRKNQGKKWVYYELTEKGAAIVSPGAKTPVFVFALSVSLILLFAGMFLAYSSLTKPATAFAPAKIIDQNALAGAEATETDEKSYEALLVQHEFVDAEKLGITLAVTGLVLLMAAFRYRKR